MSSGTAIGVLTKLPVPGRVKTRLARHWGDAAAAQLYHAMLVDTLESVRAARASRRVAFVDPPADAAALARLAARGGVPAGLEYLPQGGGDLGQRLEAASATLRAGGAARVLLVGGDCPLVDPATLRAALAALRRRDLVFGPALDGGYYLVGLARPAPEIFRDVPWSSARTLERTLARARGAGRSWALLDPLPDLDEPTDLDDVAAALLDRWRRVAAGAPGPYPRRTLRTLDAAGRLPRRSPRRVPARAPLTRPGVDLK